MLSDRFDQGLIFLAVVGLFIGSLIGAMAQIVPYGLIILTAVGMSLLAWRLEGDIDTVLVMVGMLIGSLFGNMASVIPYGVTLFLGALLAVMIWRTQGSGPALAGPTSTIGLILFMVVSVGLLWNGTYQDFCNPNFITGFDACLTPGASGYITAWQGCVTTCTINAVNVFGNSPFAYLISGDFVGFVSAFFSGSQSAFNLGSLGALGSLVTFAIGAILLVLGSGIGVSLGAEALTAGLTAGIQPNDAGSRVFQSLGISWILWAFATGIALSGGWFQYVGFGLGSATVGAGDLIYLMLFTVYTFEAYRQGKSIEA